MRWVLIVFAGLLAASPLRAQPVSTDTARLPVMRAQYADVVAQYKESVKRCAALLKEDLAYIGPPDSPMQPRDEACAQFAQTDGHGGMNTEWRDCSVNFFTAYKKKHDEYLDCHKEEERLGRRQIDMYRQMVALDQELRHAALANVDKPAPEPGWLGVKINDLDPKRAAEEQLTGRQGAYVEGTVDHSPASKAGLLAGDLITAFDGSPVRSSSDLLNYAQGLIAGQTVTVDIIRQGTPRTVYIAIEARR